MSNEVVVDATMRFRNDGEGLHRSVDPADGRHYVYGMSFMDAAPSIFACFDQPDLKAPYVPRPCPGRLGGHRQRPRHQPGAGGVGVRADPAAVDVLRDPGRGPLPRPRRARRHPLGLHARASIAKDLDADADEPTR